MAFCDMGEGAGCESRSVATESESADSGDEECTLRWGGEREGGNGTVECLADGILGVCAYTSESRSVGSYA